MRNNEEKNVKRASYLTKKNRKLTEAARVTSSLNVRRLFLILMTRFLHTTEKDFTIKVEN